VTSLVALTAGCNGCSDTAPLRVAHERLLVARVDVAGADGWFLLDTGSSGSLVSPALASKLEPANKTHHLSGFGDANRPVDVPAVKSGNIRFAGGRLKYPEEMSVLDVGFLTDWAGTKLDGILGWDVLREYVWGIDVPRARLVAGRELSPQHVLNSLGASGADATLGVKIIDELPFLTAQAQGQSLTLILDTGAERTVLSVDAWRRLGLEPAPGTAHSVIRGVNGYNTGHLARLPELRLGPMVFIGLEVFLADAASAGDRDGLVGMDVLSGCLMVMDGRAHTLYLARCAPKKE